MQGPRIAAKYVVPLDLLIAANPTVTATNLQVGQQIYIPGRSTAAQNLYWMERVIHAEADGETMQALIAVGDVIENRIQSGDYGGNMVADVVFQVIQGAYQFTSVEDGTIYENPDITNIEVAIDVIQDHDNVVPNAYVFFTPSETSSSSRVWSQPIIAQIGNFDFAK